MVDSYQSLKLVEYQCSILAEQMKNNREPPVLDLKSLQSHFNIKVDVETAVKVLHSIGILVLIKWEEFNEIGELENKQLIVLEPKWLIDVLKCVVTEKCGLKNATISKSHLCLLWKQFNETLHVGMIKLLEQLDILIEIEHDNFIIPCLLPLGGKDLSLSSSGTKGVWRRAYVLNYGIQMPVGVGGRVVGALLKLFNQKEQRNEIEVWRNGGKILCNDESGLEIQVWVDWWGEQSCVYLMIGSNYLSLGGGIQYLRSMEGSIQNIFPPFLHTSI